MKEESYVLLKRIEKERTICENAIYAVAEYQTCISDSKSITESKKEIKDSLDMFTRKYAELQHLITEDEVR